MVFGAARTVRYAGVINGDSRFTLTELNKPLKSAYGKTDADILCRHNETGKEVRIEVKEWSAKTQRANLKKAEAQFHKMAEDQTETGRLQAWVNRRANIAQVEALGKKYGIPVYGDVATGKTASKPGQMTMTKVLNDTDRRAAFYSRTVSGGFQLALGVYQLGVAGSEAWSEIERFLDPGRADQASWMRLGEQGLLAAGGGLLTVSGGIRLSDTLGHALKLQKLSSVTSKLSGLSRWSGRFGVVATLGAGVLVTIEYTHGGLTDRQFTRITMPMVVVQPWVPVGRGPGLVLGAGDRSHDRRPTGLWHRCHDRRAGGRIRRRMGWELAGRIRSQYLLRDS